MIIITVFSWLLLVYGIVSLVIAMLKIKSPTGSEKPFRLPGGIPALVVGGLLILISLTIVRVGPQDVGVLVTPNGVNDEELHTGWHFVMPWNSVHKMDKTVWVYTCAHSSQDGSRPKADAIWAPTKDGIKMGFDVSVSWRIVPAEASWIYQNVSENDGGNSGRYIWLEENVIRTKLKSALALTVSNYTPIEVYSTKREEIQVKAEERMRLEVADYKLTIDQLDLREVYYNEEFEKAVNNKKLAEQEALRLFEVTKQKEEQLKQAEIEKNIAIAKAQGEAEALKIKGSSINQNPKIIQLEWIDKWDGRLPQYMLGSDNGIILNLNKP